MRANREDQLGCNLENVTLQLNCPHGLVVILQILGHLIAKIQDNLLWLVYRRPLDEESCCVFEMVWNLEDMSSFFFSEVFEVVVKLVHTYFVDGCVTLSAGSRLEK